MPKKLSQAIIDNIINKKNVTKSVYFEIRDLDGNVVNDSQYLNSIKNYSFSLSRKFQSSTATIVVKNTTGAFSPDNEFAIIKRGYTLTIKEYFDEYSSIKFERFYGTVKQINPVKKSSGNEVEITCYDSLIKLQETDIEKVFESPDKDFIENDLLTPNTLEEPRDHLAQVFDGNYAAWANLPPPTVQITEKGSSNVAKTTTDGFEIVYKSGQVALNQVINVEDFDVKASYYYFKKGLLAEDIIKDIMLEPDSFGNDVFTLAELSSSLSAEEDTSTDSLIPITTPLNLNSQLLVKKGTSDTEVYIPRADSWKFISTYKFKIDSVDFQYNGKSDVTIGGIEMTKLLNVSGSHSAALLRGSKVEAFYDIGDGITTRAWKTTYNNVTDTISSGDFTIPGASFETFDERQGVLLVDTQIVSTTSVTLNKDYNFITLQSTGIEIPYLRLSKAKHANRFEAIKRDLLTLLPPNYVLFTQGTSRVWGKFLAQKPDGKEDYQLKLNKQIQYVTDQEVYSRVFLRGKNNNPRNVMLEETTNILNINEYGLTFNSYATDQPLRIPERGNFRTDYYPFSIYRMESEAWRWTTDSMMIYSSWVEDERTVTPTLKIDGAVLGNQIVRKSRMPVSLESITKTEWGWDFIVKMDPKEKTVNYHVRIPHKNIIPPTNSETSIVFYDVDGNVMNSLSDLVITKANTANMDIHSFDLLQITPYHPEGRKICRVFQAEDHAYFYDWTFIKSFVRKIAYVSYSVIMPQQINGKPAWYLKGCYFWIHRDLFSYQIFHNIGDIPDGVDTFQTNYYRGGGSLVLGIYSQITASFRYRSTLARVDEPQNLKDGDSATEAQLLFFNRTSIAGQPAFIIDFQRNLKVQAIDIIAGKFYPHRAYDSGFALDCEFALTLQSSNSTAFATLISDAGPSSTSLKVKWGQTANFPSSGTAFVGDDSFTYTGKTSNSFTGVSGLSETHDIGYEWTTDPETGASHRRNRYALILIDRFSNISQETTNISLKSGDAISITKDQLGDSFECRMIRAVVDHVEPVEYARRVIAYPVSLASFNVFEDVEFEADAKLSATTTLETGFSSPPSTLQVKDTSLFSSSGTAYLGTEKFTYTGKTATTFTGVFGLSEGHYQGAYIAKENVWEEEGLYVRDPNALLKEIGDKVYKQRGISQILTTQEKLNKKARDLLAEYYKNHNKVRIENVFAPYAFVGQTARLTDQYSPSFEIDRNYFIESVVSNNGNYSMELAYYP